MNLWHKLWSLWHMPHCRALNRPAPEEWEYLEYVPPAYRGPYRLRLWKRTIRYYFWRAVSFFTCPGDLRPIGPFKRARVRLCEWLYWRASVYESRFDQDVAKGYVCSEEYGSVTSKIPTYCCKCGKHIDGPEALEGDRRSHGVCKPCQEQMLKEAEVEQV